MCCASWPCASTTTTRTRRSISTTTTRLRPSFTPAFLAFGCGGPPAWPSGRLLLPLPMLPPEARLPAALPVRPVGLLSGLAPARRALCYALVALLVIIRLFEDELCAWLEAGWQRLSGAVPAPAWLVAANAAAQRSL
nr:hypothetical protein [Tanacetum cinerariifolium]